MKLPALPKQDVALPPLREDLRLIAGASAADGTPTWVIVDPVRGKYFQIGWAAYQILSRWSGRSAAVILSQIHAETTCRATTQDIDDLLRFLYGNLLMREPPQGATEPMWLKQKPHGHSG